jgi:hypothetical protein
VYLVAQVIAGITAGVSFLALNPDDKQHRNQFFAASKLFHLLPESITVIGSARVLIKTKTIDAATRQARRASSRYLHGGRRRDESRAVDPACATHRNARHGVALRS